MVKVDIGVVQQPKMDNQVNGDSYGVFEMNGRVMVVIADGLGSGPKARQASLLAVDQVRQNLQLQPITLVEILDDALRHTRGAALAIAEIDLITLHLNYVSIGNVQGLIWGNEKTLLISTPGIVGYRYSLPIQQTACQLEPGNALVLYTDGLTITNFLYQHNTRRYDIAQNLADSLVDISQRNNDDLTLLVLTFHHAIRREESND